MGDDKAEPGPEPDPDPGSEPDPDPGDDADPSRPPHPAAAAANWRTVLAVDAAVGLAVGVAGAYLLAGGSLIVGGLLAVAGALYLTRVVRRATAWAAYRRRMGWR